MKVSVILAAGEGSRMKSKKPKVIHEILGEPMLGYVVKAARESDVSRVSVIVGHGKEEIVKRFENSELIFRTQPIGDDVPYGTGFAVMQAIEDFEDEDTVLILNGDTPLVKADTLNGLMEYHERGNFSCTILTADMQNPFGYGRIVRNEDAQITRIVEEKDAGGKEKLIREINSGIFVFNGRELKNSLKNLNTDNSQGELYLTDVVKDLFESEKRIGGYKLKDNTEILGINSRDSLCIANEIMQTRVNVEYMKKGVTMIDSKSIIIEPTVEIGRDTKIYPGAILQGNTVIGEDCTIYGNTRIIDSKIGNGVIIDNALIEESVVGDGTTIGPFAHLRPKSNVGKKVKIGNFVEVKNTNFGDGSKAGHLAYIGDADVAEDVNVGCGVVFVNYDGKNKFRSQIDEGAFLGSNSNIVAPVHVEKNGYIAAGSTITKDVVEGQLAIERADRRDIKGWVTKKGLNRR
ncbi:bifunctional UDP-N-acetylglucosamine diphosphorylase/glucosamine-1-phosphate N-acetyltransferase GlmU [Peptoniphilus indolicus]|uniref:Bifunctional protein GlmU n=2 Tax=Peptoniphilus indolicus TaxID=33030 RepID=G4D3V8_9FIRM|nr:bifunctional UDP-N-acetylglucosamine diphosphorylase/glucosamine-1-phosphate N-acetyltransferase GlmU [Peptoniphilus indolicus]EGY79782.1 UDP-N-acetylglucosamine diphosphorylase [Peptoniphilus indolicus ATCC 29427]SUB75781.1 Bifunctional protein GlmU [Peptoniphilus indolicus]